ncbi:MAG: hypothetical protein U5N58_13115 [Actinomycetota bacterium]|nr:hypothetical protein [Actinomycetota bacterium]
MSRGLKDGEVEELKSRADIIDIISEYVNLKKGQESYRIMSLSPGKNAFI